MPGRSARPTVALVAHDVHDSGGMERACRELVLHLADAIDFVVVSNRIDADVEQAARRWIRVPAIRRPFPLRFLTFQVLAGMRIARINPDIVHTVGALVPNRADLAWVHFCHRAYIERTGALSPRGTPIARRVNTSISRLLAVGAERWSYRPSRLRAFHAVSPGLRAELDRFYPETPCAVTPNGVDTSRFRPSSEVRTRLRATEALGGRTRVVLFVGGDWARKGLAHAIRAVGQLRSDGEDVVLWVVGRGDAERYRTIAASAGMPDAALRFFGHRTDVELFYQAADVLVLPTQYETFSLVAYEAAACKLPVVACSTSGISDLIAAGAGVAVEADEGSVFAGLRSVIDDPARARRMAELGHQLVHERFQWATMANEVLSLYRSLLS